jgi:hypothetical protein
MRKMCTCTGTGVGTSSHCFDLPSMILHQHHTPAVTRLLVQSFARNVLHHMHQLSAIHSNSSPVDLLWRQPRVHNRVEQRQVRVVEKVEPVIGIAGMKQERWLLNPFRAPANE